MRKRVLTICFLATMVVVFCLAISSPVHAGRVCCMRNFLQSQIESQLGVLMSRPLTPADFGLIDPNNAPEGTPGIVDATVFVPGKLVGLGFKQVNKGDRVTVKIVSGSLADTLFVTVGAEAKTLKFGDDGKLKADCDPLVQFCTVQP